ncbi:MAG: CRISPR-associated endonuclease Cas1 [Candidatus Bathyarchaeia archaeon]
MTDYGSFLGRADGCLTVRHRDKKIEKYPLFENEISEIQLNMGNSASVTALTTAAMWGIDCVFLTSRGNPVAYMKSLSDDSHVKTRISQYEAIKNGKGFSIAKEIVLAKIAGQNQVLRKYGLRQHDMIQIKKKVAEAKSKNALLTIEGHCAESYFNQIFKLMPKPMKIERRRTFKAYDGTNNVFNLGYEILRWKVYRAIIRSKLEPFLGFLHSEQFSKPSLVCDVMEIYRFLIDDFLIDYCKKLRKKDFVRQNQEYSSNKKGQREFLRKEAAKDMISKLNSFFESMVEIPRIKHGNRQTIETLINEEALLLARYLRSETNSWVPRCARLV